MIGRNNLDHRPLDDCLYHFAEADRGQQARSLEEGKFTYVLVRHDIGVRPVGSSETGDSRQNPMDGPQRSFERELTEEHVAVERGFELARRLEDADGHGEIEERAFLAKIGRREVHRDTVRRKVEAGISDGALDALASLLDSCVRESHDRKNRQAVGDVDLDLHGMGRQADDTNTRYSCIHRFVRRSRMVFRFVTSLGKLSMRTASAVWKIIPILSSRLTVICISVVSISNQYTIFRCTALST